jgi:biopolymer transport protein TolR
VGMGNSNGPRSALSEINVTPLVDVMLVLLIIFMVAAGVQTVEMDRDREKMLADAERILEEADELKKKAVEHSKVEIDLPRLDSERVILSEEKKLQLVLDAQLRFSIDETIVVDCAKISPELRGREEVGAAGGFKRQDEALKPCLKALGEKLVDNAQLKKDKEIYLLADRSLDYGVVLKTMAVIRQAGVTKFGLVAEPSLLQGAETAPTPEAFK